MDEGSARVVNEVRQEVRKAAGELREIHDRLVRIFRGLSGNVPEAAQEDLAEGTDLLSEIRTAVECVNHDSLGPAIRGLLAATDDPPED